MQNDKFEPRGSLNVYPSKKTKFAGYMKKKLAKVVNLVYIKEIISGELAERSKATVSKIVILLVGIEGSNPSLSAIFFKANG